MTTRTEISLADAAKPISHYTDAVRFGDMLFISGIVALDANNQVICEGDVAGQAEAILATIGRILEQAGGNFSNILRVNVYLLDVAHRTRINPIREKYFGATRPASTLIGVAALALPGLLIEIDAVAGLPPA
jgi:reactive intermediate/imine deaminase